jgi:hypothetical protein
MEELATQVQKEGYERIGDLSVICRKVALFINGDETLIRLKCTEIVPDNIVGEVILLYPELI